MEDQIRLTYDFSDPRAPGSEFFFNAAGMVLGLSCALTFPRPGVELTSVEDLQAPLEIADFGARHFEALGIGHLAGAETYVDSSPVAVHLRSLVNSLSVPESWRNEDVELPTPECKMYASLLFCRLFNEYGLIPYKTAISKEGGIFAAYRSPRSNNVLRIELDNELDAVAVVSDGVSILDSAILDADDIERALVTKFGRRSDAVLA